MCAQFQFICTRYSTDLQNREPLVHDDRGDGQAIPFFIYKCSKQASLRHISLSLFCA